MCNADCIIFGATMLNRNEVEGKKVIEVGSYYVNGGLRPILTQWDPVEYIGVDIAPGPGVDVICPAENLVDKFGKERFDIVISTCVLEHVRYWNKAISNMKNVCKNNGILLIIVPSDWPFHSYPNDYWRFERKDVENIFSDCKIMVLEEDKTKPSLVYAKIRKPKDFLEKSLSDYNLHSIILNKKVLEISDNEINKFIKRLNSISNARAKLSKLGNAVFSLISKFLGK